MILWRKKYGRNVRISGVSQGKSRADIGNKRTELWLLVQKSDISAVVKML